MAENELRKRAAKSKRGYTNDEIQEAACLQAVLTYIMGEHELLSENDGYPSEHDSDKVFEPPKQQQDAQRRKWLWVLKFSLKVYLRQQSQRSQCSRSCCESEQGVCALLEGSSLVELYHVALVHFSSERKKFVIIPKSRFSSDGS